MARAPKKVSASFGQGVSRRSYQVGRSLGMRGTGDAGGGVKTPSVPDAKPAGVGGGGRASGSREYTKFAGTAPGVSGYSEREMPNPNLKALNSMPSNKAKPTKGFTF